MHPYQNAPFLKGHYTLFLFANTGLQYILIAGDNPVCSLIIGCIHEKKVFMLKPTISWFLLYCNTALVNQCQGFP
jgi:hypothetical protein